MSTITGRAVSRETIDAAKSPGVTYHLNMVLFDRASKVKSIAQVIGEYNEHDEQEHKKEQVFLAYVSHLMGYDGFEFGYFESSQQSGCNQDIAKAREDADHPGGKHLQSENEARAEDRPS